MTQTGRGEHIAVCFPAPGLVWAAESALRYWHRGTVVLLRRIALTNRLRIETVSELFQSTRGNR